MSYSNYTPPVFDPVAYQRQQDENQLNLLSVLHYVWGVLTILGGCFFLIYVLIGMAALADPKMFSDGPRPSASDQAAGQMMGGMFTVVGIIGAVSCWVLGGFIAYAGKCLKDRKGSTLIMVMSIINCLHVPVGTALGVFTIMAISRPSVKALFDPRAAALAYGGYPGTPPPNGGDPQQPWYRG